MEFEDMKKIWDEQNEEPLYAINEEALHRRIKSKKKSADRKNNFNDFGLIAICIITAIIYSFSSIINDTPNIYDYLVVATLLFDIGYIWVGRVRRKKKEQTFDRTMLGDLDHAISSVTYGGESAKNVVWWFGLPLITLVFLSTWQETASWWTWVVLASALILSVLASRWEYNRCYKPKKRKLEALRDKLTEETEAKPLQPF